MDDNDLDSVRRLSGMQVNQTGLKLWRMIGKWRILLAVFGSVLAVAVSICSLYTFFHQSPDERQVDRQPNGWRLKYEKTVDGLLVSIEPIPGAARILPSESFNPPTDRMTDNKQLFPSPVPLPRPKPNMWERNYAVWVPDGDIGDAEGNPDVMKLKREWRSCELPNKHPICSQPPSVRRDAKPLFGY